MRRDGAANRERILVAAEQVFGTGGAGASTEEIARQAQVGVATVFRHFPTKQDLIEATAVRYLGKLEAELRRLGDEDDPGRAFTSLVRVLVSTGATKMTLLNMLPTHGNGLTEPVTEAALSFRDAIRRVLERAQEAGDARPDVTVADVTLLVRALAHVATPAESKAVDRAVGIVLDGLGVPR
ncbi:TetR/AcrR family transcriptional regulator [Actinomadura roseirufa]|uniref:TetR/AcrR family transcriptional regulator n=1 Tax=Actinomadura roseirufa TaxID=2094049 RepID=UPI001041B984|nr:TetR/AcrR family transcriptional regulator [Actinomadura roseirufa]